METDSNLFIDLGFTQSFKHGEAICGDAFKFDKSADGERVLAVLSDGLGSGVKANILASMTATMALKFASASGPHDILHAAEIMMSALPICSVRKISYATFTIVNAGLHGMTRVIEMGNPQFLLIRNGASLELPFQTMASPKWNDRDMRVFNFQVEQNDRMVVFSDGISQSGMGSEQYPLGWREAGVAEFLTELLRERPDISSHELAEAVRDEARRKEPDLQPLDDMTCAVLYFRKPRKLLLFTGPPFNAEEDKACAEMVRDYDGDIVISGGTTSEIVARELHRELHMDLSHLDPNMPPASTMEGISLVTEGIFTLTRVVKYLQEYKGVPEDDPAGKMVELLLKNDVIDILLGTKINEAHQDPSLPQDLELRRNIVKRMAELLEHNFLKRVNIKYV